MTTKKHTPGIWKIEKRTKLFDAHISCGDKIIGFASRSPRDEANIERIVKCVNMHDDFISVIKAVLSDVESVSAENDFEETILQLRQILQKANAF